MPTSTPAGLKRLERVTKMLYGVILVQALVLLLILGLFWKENNDNHTASTRQARALACVAQWADQITARSSVLTAASITQAAAQTRLIQSQSALLSDLNLPFNRDKYLSDHAVFTRAAQAWAKTEAAYQLAQKNNPVPVAPKFQCR